MPDKTRNSQKPTPIKLDDATLALFPTGEQGHVLVKGVIRGGHLHLTGAKFVRPIEFDHNWPSGEEFDHEWPGGGD